MERLDKFLVSQSVGSRKEVSKLIRTGRVLVNGVPCADSARKIDPETETVTLDGRKVTYKKHLYILMNKPAGVLSATEDSRQKTVLDLLPPALSRRGLFPAGRLDKDTTGLLLITDDGELAHRMLAPKSHVYKRYLARLERPVTQEDMDAFEKGVTYGDLHFAPARLWAGEEPNTAYTEIREGKFHQVKRMFEAVGNRVTDLTRVQIGSLKLPEELSPGEAREAAPEEIVRIFM